MTRGIVTGKFRRRLTITFVVVAGVAAGTVGIGAYFLVRDVRSDDFVDRSIRDAEANYLSVSEREGAAAGTDIDALIGRLTRRAVEAAVVVRHDRHFSSHPTIGADDVPADLAPPDAIEDGAALPHDDTSIDGHAYLVVATPFPEPDAAMYFFYSKAGMENGLRDLARITWRLWLVVVIAAALVGDRLARRTLRPVSRASRAAQSLAEGLLATRLPVEREDEFGAWAVSFNEMAEALEAKIAELVRARDRERRFTSDVSHELRTPITALVSSGSMLEERLEGLEPDARWMAEQMIREARRLRGLVDDLLEISRLQSTPDALRPSEVDLGKLIRNVLTSHHWHDLVESRGEGHAIVTDKARLERILVNLIGNAVEHGDGRREVSVTVEADDVLIEVSDEGPGIPRAKLPHVFERFYKADPSRPGGSGLGLAIAAEHARLLGGTLAVASPEGAGATFTLRIPARSPETRPVDTAPLPA